jgi:hypothetical protein
MSEITPAKARARAREYKRQADAYAEQQMEHAAAKALQLNKLWLGHTDYLERQCQGQRVLDKLNISPLQWWSPTNELQDFLGRWENHQEPAVAHYVEQVRKWLQERVAKRTCAGTSIRGIVEAPHR